MLCAIRAAPGLARSRRRSHCCGCPRLSGTACHSSIWYSNGLTMTAYLLQAGASEHARTLGGKGSECHHAAVIGDTVGDPLKDTSGPSNNILIKLMAVESLVSAMI
jgi:Inorganic H+ pyrophosphatase